ncbi:hypothetical protein Trydic_g21542 [Trypoxylus dichotomus]
MENQNSGIYFNKEVLTNHENSPFGFVDISRAVRRCFDYHLPNDNRRTRGEIGTLKTRTYLKPVIDLVGRVILEFRYKRMSQTQGSYILTESAEETRSRTQKEEV